MPRLASPSTIFVALIVARGELARSAAAAASPDPKLDHQQSRGRRCVESWWSRSPAEIFCFVCPAVHTQFHTPASLPDKSRRIGAPRSGTCVPETLAAGPGIVVNFVCMCEEPESRLAHEGLARHDGSIDGDVNENLIDLARVPLISTAHSFLFWATWSGFEFSRTSFSHHMHSLTHSHLGRTSDIACHTHLGQELR